MKLVSAFLLSAALKSASVTSQFSESIVFVTSTTYDGNLGGLSGADDKCQARAEAVNLPGTYMAWISDSSGSPSSRFQGDPFQNPYILGFDGEFIGFWGELLSEGPKKPINVDENGNSQTGSAWTNTAVDGTRQSASLDCNDWSSSDSSLNGRQGYLTKIDATWTNGGSISCGSSQRLYCFQKSGSSPPGPGTLPPAPTYGIDLSESCVFTPVDTDIGPIGSIVCTFDTEGDIAHEVVSELRGPDCSSENPNLGLIIAERTKDPSFGSEVSTYAVSVSIGGSALQEDDTSVAFCIQASVKAGGTDDVYAQLDQEVQLNFETDGSFTFKPFELTVPVVVTDTSGTVNIIDTSLTVDVYQCDASGSSTSSSLSVAETLYICIEGDQDAVVINAIVNLQAAKLGVSTLSIIEEASIINSAITTIYVYDKVIVATKLPLGFFEDSNSIIISGDADISAGGSIRKLSMGKTVVSRPVADQGAESATFNLNIGVIPVSDPWEEETLWEDTKFKAKPNSSAACVPQASKVLAAAAVFAALTMFW